MAVCARGVQQPDGSVGLVLDPLAKDLATCTYVVQSGPDISNSFVLMSAEDGMIFSSGLVACWFSAFAVRSIINVVKGSTASE